MVRDEAARPAGHGPADMTVPDIEEKIGIARRPHDRHRAWCHGPEPGPVCRLVIIDRVAEEERVARQAPKDGSRPLPAWVLAGRPEEPNMPRDIVTPS